jgi:hypothetical protein
MPLDFLLERFHELPATRSLIERLPSPGRRIGAGGLPGSSPAALVATLARALPQRLFAVVAPTPADAERWLADLQTLIGPGGSALYPQREALGAEEPHYELAGERIETLEALLRGAVRVLITTARASAERTAVPAALEQSRLFSRSVRKSAVSPRRRSGWTRWDTRVSPASPKLRSTACAAAFSTCTALEWPRRRASSGGAMKSLPCGRSISTRSGPAKRSRA